MRKILLCFVLLALSGCGIPYDAYVERVKWCKDRGMEPIVHYFGQSGTVTGVQCRNAECATFWPEGGCDE